MVLGVFFFFFCSVRKLVEPVTTGIFYSFAHIFYRVTSLGIVIVLITPLLSTASSHWITKCKSIIRGIWGLSSGNRLYTIVTWESTEQRGSGVRRLVFFFLPFNCSSCLMCLETTWLWLIYSRVLCLNFFICQIITIILSSLHSCCMQNALDRT